MQRWFNGGFRKSKLKWGRGLFKASEVGDEIHQEKEVVGCFGFRNLEIERAFRFAERKTRSEIR